MADAYTTVREAMDQLPLFDSPLDDPVYPEGATLDERFEFFHKVNPHVYRELVKLAIERRDAGVRHGRMNALFEILRDRHELQTLGDPWKLNNSYRALYARKIMRAVPELRGRHAV